MKLVIAEKPSVAMALASVLGARTRKDGYVEGNGYIVSWCVGHLVGLCDASEYDEKYKKWRYDDLPIVPECWKHKVLEGTKKQFGILKKLMRDTDCNRNSKGDNGSRKSRGLTSQYEKSGDCSAWRLQSFFASKIKGTRNKYRLSVGVWSR